MSYATAQSLQHTMHYQEIYQKFMANTLLIIMLQNHMRYWLTLTTSTGRCNKCIWWCNTEYDILKQETDKPRESILATSRKCLGIYTRNYKPNIEAYILISSEYNEWMHTSTRDNTHGRTRWLNYGFKHCYNLLACKTFLHANTLNTYRGYRWYTHPVKLHHS